MIETNKTNNRLYKDYFVKIYDSLNKEINGYNLKQSDKLLFGFIYHGCLLNKSNAEWNKLECNWSNSVFAENCGITKEQVDDSLNNLEEAGLIKRRFKKNSRIISVIGEPEQDDTFIKMYTRVSRKKSKEFTLNDKFVYTVIHHLCENKNYSGCLASDTMIAERVGCSSRSVGRSIKKLEKDGYLNVRFNNKTREITIANDLWVISKQNGKDK